MKYKPLTAFDAIKVGDKIYVVHGVGNNTSHCSMAVIRLTKTTIIATFVNIANDYVEVKFRRSDGARTPLEHDRYAWVDYERILGIVEA